MNKNDEKETNYWGDNNGGTYTWMKGNTVKCGRAFQMEVKWHTAKKLSTLQTRQIAVRDVMQKIAGSKAKTGLDYIQYIVDRIVCHLNQNGKLQYVMRWSGYDALYYILMQESNKMNKRATWRVNTSGRHACYTTLGLQYRTTNAKALQGGAFRHYYIRPGVAVFALASSARRRNPLQKY